MFQVPASQGMQASLAPGDRYSCRPQGRMYTSTCQPHQNTFRRARQTSMMAGMTGTGPHASDGARQQGNTVWPDDADDLYQAGRSTPQLYSSPPPSSHTI
jgi:hypothetical protein